ncbi:MAG: hypothetical protein J3Q66DRAFT_323948 [Benniella sp.]|nr:MAG: hypothetical protein J3Q66DRAFT_323948 [Benniella sp.]
MGSTTPPPRMDTKSDLYCYPEVTECPSASSSTSNANNSTPTAQRSSPRTPLPNRRSTTSTTRGTPTMRPARPSVCDCKGHLKLIRPICAGKTLTKRLGWMKECELCRPLDLSTMPWKVKVLDHPGVFGATITLNFVFLLFGFACLGYILRMKEILTTDPEAWRVLLKSGKTILGMGWADLGRGLSIIQIICLKVFTMVLCFTYGKLSRENERYEGSVMDKVIRTIFITVGSVITASFWSASVFFYIYVFVVGFSVMILNMMKKFVLTQSTPIPPGAL